MALTIAKGNCAHGEWTAWRDEKFKGSHATASRYMKMAEPYFSSVRSLEPPQRVAADTSEHADGEIVDAEVVPSGNEADDSSGLEGEEIGADGSWLARSVGITSGAVSYPPHPLLSG